MIRRLFARQSLRGPDHAAHYSNQLDDYFEPCRLYAAGRGRATILLDGINIIMIQSVKRFGDGNMSLELRLIDFRSRRVAEEAEIKCIRVQTAAN